MRRNAGEEIEAQKRLVSRLREEIFGIDKSGDSPYIREFLDEFGSFRKTCSVSEVIESAASSEVVFFGDYHPLGASQRWALSLLAALAGRGDKVVLAMEMLFEYQQESLDRWMKGRYTEQQFLEIVDYESEWGFDWQSYRPFFMAARDPFVPIFGIDSPPRDQLRFIRERDAMMGRRIASIRSFFPSSRILVIVGESHLAAGHLPAEVRKAALGAGMRPPETTVIVQNMDGIYWKLMEKGVEDSSAVRVGKGRYCVFTASPILKYQSYRDMIGVWTDHSLSMPALASLLEMAENILDLLGEDRGEVPSPHCEGTVPVGEVFPELVRKKTYDSFSAFLRARRASEDAVLSVVENLRDSGMQYFPGLNLFLMVRFDRACAAREVARFVVRAMRGETGPDGRIERGEADRFYAYIFEEALAWAGGRLVDPPLDPLDRKDLAACIDSRGVVTRAVEGMTLQRTRELARMLKYHRKRQKAATRTMRITGRLREIFALDIRERQLLVRALARPLGRSLYLAYHEGRVTTSQLAGLFSERFEAPGRAASLYLEWLGRLGC